jgi:DNA-binding response OmpR family regulator
LYQIILAGSDERELRETAMLLEQYDLRVQPLPTPEFSAERLLQHPPVVLVVDLDSLPLDTARRALADAHLNDHTALVALVTEQQLSRLQAGAPVDDFVLRPLHSGELAVRIRLLLRRRTNVDEENLLRCGDLAIDLANYKVTIGGRPVELTFKEYELLRFLMSNQAKVFTREQLLNRVWGYDYYGGARTVDVHIRRLRSKIELRPGDAFIDTVRNVGYRFKEC